jgi:Sulfotransferase family
VGTGEKQAGSARPTPAGGRRTAPGDTAPAARPPGPLPNFLIAGAARSGTTSLANYVGEHPDAFIPARKETMFFIAEFYARTGSEDVFYSRVRTRYLVETIEQYRALFAPARGRAAVGEASVSYLYLHQMAVPRIRAILGDPRIIIILRDPVERALSAYTYVLREVAGTPSFEEFLALEAARRQGAWDTLYHPVQVGMYSRQVQAFLEAFSRVKILLYEDLCADPRGVMAEVYRFLAIDDAFVPAVRTAYNASGVPVSRGIYDLLYRSFVARRLLRPAFDAVMSEAAIVALKERVRRMLLRRPPLRPETEARLRALFTDDVTRLQDLIGRDLSAWLPGSRGVDRRGVRREGNGA